MGRWIETNSRKHSGPPCCDAFVDVYPLEMPLSDCSKLRMSPSEIDSALKKLGKKSALTYNEFKELMWVVYEKVCSFSACPRFQPAHSCIAQAANITGILRACFARGWLRCAGARQAAAA
jgi:hypothetical protein